MVQKTKLRHIEDRNLERWPAPPPAPRPGSCRARGHSRGVTLLEMLVVGMVLAVMLYALLRIWTAMRAGSDQSSMHASYYFASGHLLDQMTMDVKSALEVRRQKNRLELLLPEGKDSFATVKVNWFLEAKGQTVVRECGGKSIRFEFGTPPARGEALLFEIE